MIVENARFRLEITEEGGEIQSFFDKEKNKEYMWQGHPDYWKGKNPTLFPMVSNTWTKDYQWHGKSYAMKNHGLIRYATLNCVEHTENSITMELKSNEETKAQYPFDFTYQIKYVLSNSRVDVIYHITNNSAEAMPFIFGLHPGFNVPVYEDETFEDYRLVFPHAEKTTWLIHNDSNFREEPTEVKEWQLNHADIYDKATIVYKNLTSPFVDLVGKHHTLRVSILGYKYLALWTAGNNAPFLCIEPWYGHGDFEANDKTFDQREDTINLLPNKTFTTSYYFEIRD